MISSVKKSVDEMDQALKSDNLKTIKEKTGIEVISFGTSGMTTHRGTNVMSSSDRLSDEGRPFERAEIDDGW